MTEAEGTYHRKPAIWVTALSILMAVLYASTGAHKLIGWQWAKESYLHYHSLSVYYASGVIELVGGVALLWPRTRFIAAVSILLMSVLVAAHPWQGDWRTIIVPAVTLSGLLLVVAWKSRPVRSQ